MDYLLNSNSFLDLFPFWIAYTEMHYRFKFTGSRYFKEEPEILADMPYRLIVNHDLPVMILIKDADKYPIFLDNVSIELILSNGHRIDETYDIQKNISDHFWSQIIHIDKSHLMGHATLNVLFRYRLNNKLKTCTNHNFVLLPHTPFSVLVNQDKLPGNNKILWGDIHYHSSLTEDMVEFGAPLSPTRIVANALGLSFFCATDHSYDLDDLPGSWRKPDENLKKWNDSRDDIQNLNNTTSGCSVIPSEEVTVRNFNHRNVHALVLNNIRFIPGSGDSGERPFKTTSEHSISDLSDLTSNDSVIIAAHPTAPTPLLQWLFIKRGIWKGDDCVSPHVSGLQIMNGSLDKGFHLGKKKWLDLLREGYRKFIYAGNDAHGNFNKFRQIKIPMLSLWEKSEQIFGEWKTGVFTNRNNVKDILSALKKGNCIISDGPFLNFEVLSDNQLYKIGSICYSNNIMMKIICESSTDFGVIKAIKIFLGYLGKKEYCYQEIIPDNTTFQFVYEKKTTIRSSCYFRVELETQIQNKVHFAMTNPIWISPQN